MMRSNHWLGILLVLPLHKIEAHALLVSVLDLELSLGVTDFRIVANLYDPVIKLLFQSIDYNLLVH